jgi:hypothetical protein
MLDQEKTSESGKEQVLAIWERPQVSRLEATDAEAAGAPVADVVYS